MHVSLNTSVRNCTKSQQMSHVVKYLRGNDGCKDVCCHSCLCARLVRLQLRIRSLNYIPDQNVSLSFASILTSDFSDQIGEEATTSLLHMSLKWCVDNTKENNSWLKMDMTDKVRSHWTDQTWRTVQGVAVTRPSFHRSLAATWGVKVTHGLRSAPAL